MFAEEKKAKINVFFGTTYKTHVFRYNAFLRINLSSGGQPIVYDLLQVPLLHVLSMVKCRLTSMIFMMQHNKSNNKDKCHRSMSLIFLKHLFGAWKAFVLFWSFCEPFLQIMTSNSSVNGLLWRGKIEDRMESNIHSMLMSQIEPI